MINISLVDFLKQKQREVYYLKNPYFNIIIES
jgi:hypothetical protein